MVIALEFIDVIVPLGFDVMETRDGKQIWKDVCVVESMFGGTTLPCEWIEVDSRERIAFLKGTERGAVAGRRDANR